jgi:hypothetical protein
VEEALQEGLLYKIFNYDAQCFVLFPVDTALAAEAHVDEDVLALYKATKVGHTRVGVDLPVSGRGHCLGV